MAREITHYYIDKTPHRTERLQARFVENPSDYEKEFLSELACWSGPDKRVDFEDGSYMLSWEYTPERIIVVKAMLTIWFHTRAWVESPYQQVWLSK